MNRYDKVRETERIERAALQELQLALRQGSPNVKYVRAAWRDANAAACKALKDALEAEEKI